MYVIKRNEDGKYVARSGSEHSYTRALEHARVFPTYAAAESDCCGNERIVSVENIMGYRR